MKEFAASQILSNLWLGGERSAKDQSFLQVNKITHILVAGLGLRIRYPMDYHYLVLNGKKQKNKKKQPDIKKLNTKTAWDWEVEDMLRFVGQSIQFIEDAISKGGTILIHW